MKDIEKLISPLIENQFPSFYKEDGPQFIAFVRAYYEWMEEETQIIAVSSTSGFFVGDIVTQTHTETNQVAGRILSIDSTLNQIHILHTSTELTGEDFSSPGTLVNVTNGNTTRITDEVWSGGVLHHARHLGNYRDIDTTLEKFVVHFKEKYLKNIQFDTATNKKLLVKNSLDLYRSKGTERSIDLFFKLVYGTAAEVKYPGENILRLSDGIWEKPEYLEVTYNEFNVNYVGKQIIGALSGAKAFVEKYVRRRVGRGYVNLLYISGKEGAFRNGEVIGTNVNNVADYTNTTHAQLVGSVQRVTIVDKGANFKVGDIVNLQGSQRGIGGLARVTEVSDATGIVDFIFVDGGWGYTLNATSLISEKVLTLDTISANVQSDQYFRLFEQFAQPLINVAFTSATANLVNGDYVYRYAANGQIGGYGVVIDTDQANATGQVTISHIDGVLAPNVTYYVGSNTASFFANTIEDRTISGKVMGIPEVYTLELTNQTGTLEVGQTVYQKNTIETFARGTVNSITQTATGNIAVLINASGAFKNSTLLSNATYTVATGTITANTANNIVIGSATSFDNNIIGAIIYANGNTAIGTVNSISNSTSLVLTTNAASNITANVFNYALQYPVYVDGNTSISAHVDNISATVGVYEIKKYVNTVKYQSANNDQFLYADELYQYNAAGNVISEGMILTVNHDTGTSTGNITFIPVKGYFRETDPIYTNGNTSTATVVALTTSNTGGDYISSPFAHLVAPISNTHTILSSISQGTGASFGVGTIGDTEVVFVGTDLIGSNNIGTLDYDRKILTVASNTGFALGDAVYQTVNKIGFNASSSVNEVTGFITLPTANTKFSIGDNIRYSVDTGNTALNGLVDGNYYYIGFANSTGIILSYPYRKTDQINTANFADFANNKISEVGHYFYKQVYGTVFESSTGVVKIKDRVNFFGNTGGTANTTTAANSNLIKYTAPSTNTNLQNVTAYTTLAQANVPYGSISIRAAAYGLPKNPQGDLVDSIYSCLGFGRFEIGTIGSLSQVDPGAEYNVDPYVLAYQPYIAGFNRNDFVITVNNATRAFVTGERINQVQANLAFYDLQVNSGAYSNTYDEIAISIDTKNEIDSAADFVYSPSNTTTFNANTGVASDFITLTNNPFSSNDYIRYYVDAGNTVISGLSNNAFYYVGLSNTTGITVSLTAGGANVALTASATSESGHNIRNYINNLVDDQRIIYRTPTANTIIDGLANNTAYYLVSSNTVGFKLSTTQGGSVQAINAAATSETHTISTIPGYLPADRVYQNVASIVANAIVQSIFSNTTGDYVRVSGNTGPLATNEILWSYTNPYVNATVSTVTLQSVVSSAKGIIKAGSNSSVLYVKRLTFENTFQSGVDVIGDVSGAHANVVGITEDSDELYPIGLNAIITANVTTANGQVTSLDVFDSGFGYTNGESIQYVSSDNTHSGSAKLIIDGAGVGKGYYRSSKGFLSEDMYIHDGDYYQEYSYEVLSKISVDRYSDMFKKVMHVAGTKFFGSALIVEEANVALTISSIATGAEVQFNSATDVSSINETIDTDITPNPFANGDTIVYTTATSNTALQGLTNTAIYYIVGTSGTTVKLATSANGSAINITANTTTSGSNTAGHYLTKTVEE